MVWNTIPISFLVFEGQYLGQRTLRKNVKREIDWKYIEHLEHIEKDDSQKEMWSMGDLNVKALHNLLYNDR